MRERNHALSLPVIGVDIGGTQVRVAILQGATLLSRMSLLTGENPLPDHLLPRIYGAIQKALEETSIRLDQVIGIGISSPGPLDSHTGVVFDPLICLAGSMFRCVTSSKITIIFLFVSKTTRTRQL